MSDSTLIDEFSKGHSKCFDELIKRYRDSIYGFIFSKVKDHDIADDMYQDITIKIFDKLSSGSYKDINNFRGWALAVSNNHYIDYFRKIKRSVEVVVINDDEEEGEVMKSLVPSIETTLIREQLCVDVRGMIERLPPEQREVVVLRHYGDKSFKEIAEMRNENVNTSLGRMRYALINLRKMLNNGKTPHAQR
jgi:RNA polymerase sigma-70 factor (ECF subfamily)